MTVDHRPGDLRGAFVVRSDQPQQHQQQQREEEQWMMMSVGGSGVGLHTRPRLRPSSTATRAMNRVVDHLEERKAVLTKIFRDFDKNSDNAIDRGELDMGLRGLGLRLTSEQLDGVMTFLDTDGGGDIDLAEFLQHFRQLRSERGYAQARQREELLAQAARRLASNPVRSQAASPAALCAMECMIDHLVERKASVTKMFMEYDRDRSGAIDRHELGRALQSLGLRLERRELDGVMSFLDTDGNGEIELQEFLQHFKAERAKRFEGHVPELKQAKEELLRQLRATAFEAAPGSHGSLPPQQDKQHKVYRLLVVIEQLQSLENLSSAEAKELRSFMQGVLKQGELEGGRAVVRSQGRCLMADVWRMCTCHLPHARAARQGCWRCRKPS